MSDLSKSFINDYYLIEGFDSTGKLTFAKKILKDHKLYIHNHSCFEFLEGYSIFDFIDEIRPMEKIVIKGGSPITDYCNHRLYRLEHLDQKIIDYFKDNQFFVSELGHIYLRHRNVETAETFYNEVQFHQKFNSFSDYWIYYKTADGLYHEIYQKLGIKPRIFEISSDLSSWEEVNVIRTLF